MAVGKLSRGRAQMAEDRHETAMTREKLEQLKWLNQEIPVIRQKIAGIYEKEIPIVKDRVQASGREWPYVEGNVNIRGYDEKAVERQHTELEKLEAVLKKRQLDVCTLKAEIEDYISSIEDSRIRLMFEYRFVDGYKSAKVGKMMNCDRTTVEKTIVKYLNEHP
jgi:hypothetical protein